LINRLVLFSADQFEGGMIGECTKHHSQKRLDELQEELWLGFIGTSLERIDFLPGKDS